MPGGSIASPTLRTDELADAPQRLKKKKKSVMGLLKSTISTKLGRRKSLTGEDARSPTDKDLSVRQQHPEAQADSTGGDSARSLLSPRESRQQQDEEGVDGYGDDDEVEELKLSSRGAEWSSSSDDRTDSMTTAASSPFGLRSALVGKTPVTNIGQVAVADEEEEGESEAVAGEAHLNASEPFNQHVAAAIKSCLGFSPRTPQPVEVSEVEEEEQQQDEVEKEQDDGEGSGLDGEQQASAGEEVFAMDYAGGCAPPEQDENAPGSPAPAALDADTDDEQLEVFDDGQGGNQAPSDQGGERVGSASIGSTIAPVSDGLMVIGRSPAKTALHRSPEKRLRPLSLIPEALAPPQAPIESSATSSPAPSPVKSVRSGGVNPPTASSPTKLIAGELQPRRPSEQHMESIQEEDKPSASPAKAQRPALRRRSSVRMDAPILASSFVSSRADVAEEDDEATSEQAGGREGEPDATGAAADEASAFAFDAGAAITQAFGDRVARLLGADPWGDRQDGFDAIQLAVRKTDLRAAGNKRELLCAALAAVQCGVEDRVAPVMYCALECLRAVLKEFASALDRSFSRFAPLNEQLSALLQALVRKLGDANKRTQREAVQAIARLAKLRKLRALPHVLLHLSAKDVAPRLQLEVLRRLVQDLGLSAGSDCADPAKSAGGQQPCLTLDIVMQFVAPSLKVADEKTRKAAVELLADLQLASSPAAVNARLAGVKPDLLRVISRRVDELLAQRELERQQRQGSANQSEERRCEAEEAEAARAAELLVPVLAEDSCAAAALLETQLAAAAALVGPVAWRKLLSKTWSDRKEALVDLGRAVTEAKAGLRDAKPAVGSAVQLSFCAYCVVAHRLLGDAIQPVVNEALELLTTLVKVFGACVEWREETVRDLTLLTLARLFQTMHKPQNRTTRAACRCVLRLARLPNSQHPLRYTLSCVFAKDCDVGVQMHLLRLLVPELGFQSEGLSAALVLAAAAAALGHASDKVRRVAADVVLATQRLVGRALVLDKLKDVKSTTLKELEKSFVDVARDATERPQTVHAAGVAINGAAGALPPVQFSSDRSRRQLNSAPVGIGRLQCTPQEREEDERAASASTGGSADADTSSPHVRRQSTLDNEEENLMDAILGGGD